MVVLLFTLHYSAAMRRCIKAIVSISLKQQNCCLVTTRNFSTRRCKCCKSSVAELQTTTTTKKLKGVIGLEIHAQINSKSKLFSGSSAEYGAAPNTNVSYFDAALPGTLPVLNKYCVEAAVKTSLAFGSDINKVSAFDRKHYFYADLPAGYQITQQRKPIATGGTVDYVIFTRGKHKTASRHSARIHQIQLEQDSGKSIHDDKNNRSLIDLNRAGCALMEVVTEPDFESGEQAAAFVREVQNILMDINTCDGRMEEGSLRVDANVSVHEPGEALGIRTEVKNLNSVKSVQDAIDYEIRRQIDFIHSGGEVINETMSYDSVKRVTLSMRDKERLQDYRFMPEPNLPPVVLTDESSESLYKVSIQQQRAALPESRETVRDRLLSTGLHLEKVAILMELDMVHLFESLMELSSHGFTALKLYSMLYSVIRVFCGEKKITVPQFTQCVDTEVTADILAAVQRNQIADYSAIKILHEIWDANDQPISDLLTLDKYSKITDVEVIRKLCDEVLGDKSKVVRAYKRKGRSVDFNYLLKVVRERCDYRIDYTDAVTELNKALELKLRQMT